jgi:hypothetical protein
MINFWLVKLNIIDMLGTYAFFRVSSPYADHTTLIGKMITKLEMINKEAVVAWWRYIPELAWRA